MSLLGTGINVAKPVISIQTVHLILVIDLQRQFRYKQTNKQRFASAQRPCTTLSQKWATQTWTEH